MRCLILATCLLYAAAARADWTPVAAGNEVFAPFADLDSIRRDGAMARMAALYDFRRQDFTPEGRGLFSTVVLREYDCEGKRVRLLSYVDFSGHMGTGSAVATHQGARRWEPIVPGALDDAFLALACRAKGS